jgi:hypothetical protein
MSLTAPPTLTGEQGMTDVSYPVVRAYVAERKPQVRAEAGRGPAEVFVRQSHRPGDEAEVDFGEVVIRLAGRTSGASCSAGGCRSRARQCTDLLTALPVCPPGFPSPQREAPFEASP